MEILLEDTFDASSYGGCRGEDNGGKPQDVCTAPVWLARCGSRYVKVAGQRRFVDAEQVGLEIVGD